MSCRSGMRTALQSFERQSGSAEFSLVNSAVRPVYLGPPHKCRTSPSPTFPSPTNPTQFVPPKALSRIATCPVRPPTAVGVNVTSMVQVQLASGLRLLPQVLVCAAAHALASLSEDPGLLRARRARYQADVEAPSLAYSAFACLRTGMSGSAYFQRAKKSW
jgi:hypothetical protein